ncbi:MAG: hypothetical protein AAFN77_21945 [Planctomycetota bacterium]
MQTLCFKPINARCFKPINVRHGSPSHHDDGGHEPDDSIAQESAEQEKEPASGDSTDEPPSNLLGKASDLFQKATKSSSDSAQAAGGWIQDKLNGATESSGDAVAWANQTFESLKAKGLTTASDTSEWLTTDWNNMESWEYKIISSASMDNAELESKLNELGAQGWECFDVTGDRLMLKKPRESYLRRLPFKDLLRLAPLMNMEKK